jgi:hypothetical protein
MKLDQEETLYEFLENSITPFTSDEILDYIQDPGQKRNKELLLEINVYLETRKIAFKKDAHLWVSRRGCFEKSIFAISPTRLELLNGILIPGHRCVPFANPLVMPHRYQFVWDGKPVPDTTTEAPPEELYPFYCIYGEEFAPQYIARENPKNEEAFNSDPYEEPVEVSIRVLDMRQIYRECSFVPGDRFVVRILDWKECKFELAKADKWQLSDLDKWMEAAEGGFDDSFALLGPGTNTEEQIAFAYWFGGDRMREVPAFSLEEFLYEKTNQIETAPFGIETRFWFAGKEIPDSKGLFNLNVPPDRTDIEDMLYKINIPISEFVIFSYIKDAFFHNEKEIDNVINRIIPPIINLDRQEWNIFADFLSEAMDDFSEYYSLFLDQGAGPVRQRAAELHTAVVELAARLQQSEIEPVWLPKHTFIVLSQIQSHAAALLEDLAYDESPTENEITAMDHSLDSMLDTFTEVKELINNALDNYRRSSLTVIHSGGTNGQLWQKIQISICGLDVWRRAVISCECTIKELHRLIQAGMGWKDTMSFRFYCETPDGSKEYQHDQKKLGDIDFPGKKELGYEYGKWNVSIIMMSSYQPVKNETSCFTGGENAAPPEQIDGPRHFRKLLFFLESGNNANKQNALRELGDSFETNFNLEKTNRSLHALFKMDES